MEIILLENVLNLGNIGDKVKVKNGYGRNFLLKTGKALRASEENIDLVNKKKTELNKKNNQIKLELKEVANKIDKKTLNFIKEAKDNGDLFGSIKPKEISNSFKNDLRVEINPSQIDINKEINKIGKYKIKITLHSEVSANVTISVEKKD